MNTKKNLLDLSYNKNLQYYTTTVIIMFTYFIAASIAIITKQIDYKNLVSLTVLIIISAIVIGVCTGFLYTFKKKMENVMEEISNLSS